MVDARERKPVTENSKINISGKEVLERVWEECFPTLPPPAVPSTDWFVIDESLPATVVYEARELELTPVQVCAALDYWRNTMIQAVDEVAVRLKQQAEEQQAEE
jgi:hypothetical protein